MCAKSGNFRRKVSITWEYTARFAFAWSEFE